MSRTLAILLSIAVAAALVTISAGCGESSGSSEVPSGADLEGTWIVKASAGYDQGKPSTFSDDSRLVIDKAEGQAFAGYKAYTDDENGAPTLVREVVNGAIAANGEILITDEDGFFEGTLQDGVMTGRYAELGEDNTAMTVEYARE